MSPLKRSALLAGLLMIVLVLLSATTSTARPAYTYGVGCMASTHSHMGTPTNELDDEQVHVDPRNIMLTPTPPWHAEYKRYNSLTHQWDPSWIAVRDVGDVDAVYCCPGTGTYCTEGSGEVTTWAYQTAAMPLEIYTSVLWHLVIDSGCDGAGCTTETSWPVLVDIDSNGYDVPGTTACSAGSQADFVVDVPH